MFDFQTQGPYRTRRPIILASASPRRQALLGSLGIYFEVIPAKSKEPAPLPEEAPSAYAERMAIFKAQEIADKRPDTIVIGADTIVVQGPEILGKPRSKEDALRMLTSLCGRTHEVITGICIMHKMDKKNVHMSVSTQVVMPKKDQATLKAYIATGEPMDKAGSYAIQGVGGFLVSEISGSYTNVVGLPLARILEVLVGWEAVSPAES